MRLDAEEIYALIREVPKSEVASYGMIASLVPGVGPRQAARALRTAPKGLPWHRIITSSGCMADHSGAEKQKRLLKAEGVTFKKNGAVDWGSHRWSGPSQNWITKSQLDIEKVMEIIAGWKT
ncbi:MGMT family protein [Hyphococcus flavus]|uniref:MGMT family protein n=1 Tax=Hyphococcus flavus TaxID=1866326 RepID=A0AAF0CFA7_9PROT|nr:MGMT family protein [Hyphococcus flavus]WDI32321.1 MGMT family protein [Hyphococcus flavus]